MREPRAFAELETKIGQEEKPAQKPAEPKQTNPMQGQVFPDKTFGKAQKKIDADKETYKVIPGFKFPFEEGYDEDYERSYGPGADADDIDQELAYSKDLYEGKSDDEVIATLSQRLNTHPEKIKKLWDEREAAYQEGKAQFPKLEKLLAETYPEGTDEYNTFDSQFLLHFMYDALPKPLGGDQLDKIEKDFARYLHSKGYKDVSNNPIVDYEKEEEPKKQEELRQKFRSKIFAPTDKVPYWTFDDPYLDESKSFKSEEDALRYAEQSEKKHNDWVSKEATRLIDDFRQGKVTSKDLKQFGRSQYAADILAYLLGQIK